MYPTGHIAGRPVDHPLCVRIADPDCEPLTGDDLQRLFEDQDLSPDRLERLCERPRVLAACDDLVVGIATYRWADRELLAGDIGIDVHSPCDAGAVIDTLLKALELAGMAAGRERLVLTRPQRSVVARARARGYTVIGAARVEKPLL